MFVNTSLGYVGDNYFLKEYEYNDDAGNHIICKPDTITTTIKYLVTHGMLSDIDKEIMGFIYKFVCVNAATINKYVNCSARIPESMKKDNYEVNLKRLRMNGILVMYSAGENFNLYTLSNGARLYLSLEKGRKYYNKIVPDSIPANEYLKYAVLAQFVISLKCIGNNRNFKVDVVRNKVCSINGRDIRLDSLVYLKSESRRTVTIFPVCARKGIGWGDYIADRIKDISDICTVKRSEFNNLIVVVMVEDYDHILDVYKLLAKKELLFNNELLTVYATDRVVYDNDLLENVYVCENDNEGIKIQNKSIKI